MTVDANRVSLLPCPFCGSAGKMIRPMGERVFNKDENGRAVPPYYGPEWFRVICDGHDCHCAARAYADEAEAIAAWNRRSPSLSGGEVNALRDIAAATDPDDPDSYRNDDREGCLDTVHAIASGALSTLNGAKP